MAWESLENHSGQKLCPGTEKGGGEPEVLRGKADATHSGQRGRISSKEKLSSSPRDGQTPSREAAEFGVRAIPAVSVLGMGRRAPCVLVMNSNSCKTRAQRLYNPGEFPVGYFLCDITSYWAVYPPPSFKTLGCHFWKADPAAWVLLVQAYPHPGDKHCIQGTGLSEVTTGWNIPASARTQHSGAQPGGRNKPPVLRRDGDRDRDQLTSSPATL